MNAIILAAGLGSRFKELTRITHKALLPISGVPNLERTIRLLNEAEVYDIYIVTGYLAEQFDFLIAKYPGVHLVNNPEYRRLNSIYSFSKVLPYFGDSFVIDADCVFVDNVFKNKFKDSTYLTILRRIHGVEWCPVTDSTGRVIKMEVTDAALPSMSGVSYWSISDAAKIKSVYDQYLTPEFLEQKQLYWDSIPVKILSELQIYSYQVADTSMYEMDNQENYQLIQKILKSKS